MQEARCNRVLPHFRKQKYKGRDLLFKLCNNSIYLDSWRLMFLHEMYLQLVLRHCQFADDAYQ